MDSFEKFKEKKLPDIDCFFSSLKDCGITEEECQRACNVWKVFGFKTLGEYHYFYLKTDVLLLCDVFEKFISVCLIDYGLDPCHYFSSPGLSWNAMLKMTGVRLVRTNDIDIHLFLEKGIRGGDVSYISKRYSKGSDDKTIMYWDMNNLYGTVMSFDYSPYEGFRFLSEEEIKVFDLGMIPENSLIGYILEVNLKYCCNLHNLYNDYPLCPEKIEVGYEMLSKYCREIVDWYGIKVGGVKKLIANLYDKVRYVIHDRNLLYYLSFGMELIKIHKILSFKQSNWLKVFTDFNTKKRQESPDEFSKGSYKLMNNCIYGKSIENIENRINVKLINDQKTYLKCVNKPSSISSKITDKNFVAVHCSKKVLTLNKPIYVEFCILELNKLLMYKFHYDYVLKTFNDAKLLFTDTDSLVYEISGDNVYEQCFKDKHLFDFS